MAFDEVLADRVRDLTGLPDKRMFGGIAFLLSGNMAVGVIGDDLIVRVGPAAYDALVAEPGARPFDMTGRPMSGWLVVAGDVLDEELLPVWVDRGVAFAASLPPK